MRKFLSLILIFSFLLSFSMLVTSCNNSTTTSSGISGGGNPFIKYYSVKFVTNGGDPIQTQKVSDYLTNAPTPERSGYLFDGWFFDPSFTAPVTFPLSVNADVTLYARWLKLTDQARCNDCSIKLDTKLDFSATYIITPSGFDLEKLNLKGYSMRITVTYDVRYVKDYNVLWDIGYAGSPKYEILLLNNSGMGKIEEDMSTTTSRRTRTISLSMAAADLIGDKITLTFSTNNVQNIIYFENIVITYECY